jgi:hypothetical protein
VVLICIADFDRGHRRENCMSGRRIASPLNVLMVMDTISIAESVV